MIFELLEPAVRERNAMDHEVAHAPELDQIESADCGERLVLATDRLIEDFAFDLDRLVSQVEPRHQAAAKCVDGVEQAHHERRRRAQACERRELGGMIDLDVFRYSCPAKALAEGCVLEFIDRRDTLDLAVGDLDRIIEHLAEEWGDAEVG